MSNVTLSVSVTARKKTLISVIVIAMTLVVQQAIATTMFIPVMVKNLIESAFKRNYYIARRENVQNSSDVEAQEDRLPGNIESKDDVIHVLELGVR